MTLARYSRAAEEDKTLPLDRENQPPPPALSSMSTPTLTHNFSPLLEAANSNNNSPATSSFMASKKPTNVEESGGEDAKKETRIFVEKKFQLSPTLNVLGDFTPKVATVFGWLGIKDINHTIPYYTHIGLTDPLESTLESMWSFYNGVTQLDE